MSTKLATRLYYNAAPISGLLATPRATRGSSNTENTRLLLPTPRTIDVSTPCAHGQGGPDLITAIRDASLLPTPTSNLGMIGSGDNPEERRAQGHSVNLKDIIEKGDTFSPASCPRNMQGHHQRYDDTCLFGTLLPTPTASQSGNTAEEHLQKKPGRRQITDLNVLAGNRFLHGPLLPTPQAHDAHGGKTPEQVAEQRARTGAGVANLNEVIPHTLLPTPRASDGEKGGPNQHGSSGDLMLPSAAQHTGFSQYVPVLDRWAAVLGRDWPEPLIHKPGNKNPQLSHWFVEFMMGLPKGWVCGVPGVTRNMALRLLGNGVVPQQAATAFTLLWPHLQKTGDRA